MSTNEKIMFSIIGKVLFLREDNINKELSLHYDLGASNSEIRKILQLIKERFKVEIPKQELQLTLTIDTLLKYVEGEYV